ncbi:uridine diphosphate-N-acetylglucosamine-binding protein YvcK [Sodalis sp. dw_96]|uniref:uridine diphosphate-N-acetylglucosamine-binding protein YvcK n=1 Tax=Sodalis sp. dw_96 TaxID=2719794 RepID=UPI001BD3A19E|nr:uridine diphosphate-N-acetylglucosamine-binding protein YvcK [Sodalis sp. dw_96]
MGNPTLAKLKHVVALGGGHGLGRAMSALSSLGSGLTGIVTTTDNGGSTGRIRLTQGGIAWGDTRTCLNQLVPERSIAAAMFEYRFSGRGELAGHNLGNLMLTALDDLSVRPLEAINLIRSLLKVEAQLIPMSEQPVDLQAEAAGGEIIYGEVAVDNLRELPIGLGLCPTVTATPEALEAISAADLILLGPGSFLTSLMPLLLLPDLTQALRQSRAPLIYIDNLGRELSVAAANLRLRQKLDLMERAIGGQQRIDGLILGPDSDAADARQRLAIQQPLAALDIPHHHDRVLLRDALEKLVSLVG